MSHNASVDVTTQYDTIHSLFNLFLVQNRYASLSNVRDCGSRNVASCVATLEYGGKVVPVAITLLLQFFFYISDPSERQTGI